jgi:RNA polymerase sigma-70 factor (ECF subfamily)
MFPHPIDMTGKHSILFHNDPGSVVTPNFTTYSADLSETAGIKATMQQEQEFTKLYNQYAPGILKLCKGYTGDSDLAQDLLHETFIAVWNSMHKFRGDAAWGTWIYRIGVNTCLAFFRKKKIRITDIDNVVVDTLPMVSEDKEQQIEILYKAISKLEKTDRLIIAMVLEDKPYSEIATIFGITENNLRVRIYRIKKELIKIYNDYERL